MPGVLKASNADGDVMAAADKNRRPAHGGRAQEHRPAAGVVNLHDGHLPTIRAMPELIHQLRLRGFVLVTVDDLL